jgi:hypothetical protein
MDRKTKAIIFIAIGLLLIIAPGQLGSVIATAPPLVQAGIFFMGPLGLIFLVLGIYRAATQGKSEKEPNYSLKRTDQSLRD